MSVPDKLKKRCNVNITIKTTSVFLPLLAWGYVSQDISVLWKLKDQSWGVTERAEEDLSIKYSNKHLLA